MLDLESATGALTDIVDGVTDEQLNRPTPCTESSVGDLIDHLDGLSMAFTAAAAKVLPEGGSRGPSADGSRLGPDWRERVPERLTTLAAAWRDEGAWMGMTQAGGIDVPGEVAGIIALNEIIVHGWDIAVASDQRLRWEPALVQAANVFMRSAVARHPEGTPGLFGPSVPVPEGAPLLDQLIGLTGRHPAWRPPAAG
jgi:uncharacterized protein (TIGR03086 family)